VIEDRDRGRIARDWRSHGAGTRERRESRYCTSYAQRRSDRMSHKKVILVSFFLVVGDS
jgi:hypothetical protein